VLVCYRGLECFDVICTFGRSLLLLFGVDQLDEDAKDIVVRTRIEMFTKVRSLLDRPPDAALLSDKFQLLNCSYIGGGNRKKLEPWSPL
jgi:hypothetical protein